MTYEQLLDIMDNLKDDLESYLGMIDTDEKIVLNRNCFPQLSKSEEIIEGYVEEMQEILDSLKNNIK